MVSGNASEELFLSTLFPKKWIIENIDYIEKNTATKSSSAVSGSRQLAGL
jgi:hypothetical protein